MSEYGGECIDRTYAWVFDSVWPPESANRAENKSMPTPPPSDENRRDGSPKRRRVDLGDINRTPTSSRSRDISDLPYRALNPPNLAPSLSASESSRASSRASKSPSRRAGSPTKSAKRIQLQALKKPVFYKSLDDNATCQLPTDVKQLYNRIDQITVERIAFLPCTIRDEICSATGRNLGDSWFTKPQANDDRDRDLKELRRLQHIVTRARKCQELNRSEASWNAKIHEPFLELVLEPFDSMVESEPVPDARILTAFLPMTDIEGTAVESKIDIALVLDPSIADEDKPLANRIRQAVLSQPAGEQSVNQTGYSPLIFRPAACFIETKTAGSAEEGRIQLGIFAAALQQRLELLVNAKYRTTETEPRPLIITLLHILTLEHDWKLFFGCDRGDYLEMVGDLSAGDTKSLIGAYILLEVMREIARYIVSTYKQWIYNLFTPSI